MVALPELLPFMLRRGGVATELEEEFNVAFPFTTEENFESGTFGIFSEGSDTLGRIAVIGPTDAHEIPPYLGGYVVEIDLNRGAAPVPDAYLVGNSALAFASGSTRYARLMIYLSPDLKVPGAGDSVKFFQLMQSATEEASIGLVRGNKGELMLGIWHPDLSAWVRGIEVDRAMWLPLEIAIIHAGTASKLQVMCLGSQVEATSLNFSAALTDYRIGAVGQSNDIRGKYWFDHWVVDATDRLVAPQPLDPRALDNETILMTKTGYAFVGAGMVNCATLVAGGTDNFVFLYDTDRLPVAHHDARMAIRASTAEMVETKGPRTFKRGCYVTMTGTSPQVLVQLGGVTEFGWGGLGSEGF